jgi:hypothetical protein
MVAGDEEFVGVRKGVEPGEGVIEPTCKENEGR